MHDKLIFAIVPFYIIMMAGEMYAGFKRGAEIYEKRDTIASLSMGIGNGILRVGYDAFFLWVLTRIYTYRVVDLPREAWWMLPLAILAYDFCFYWFHRLHHEVRWLWASHVNHHSSERYNLSTALRQSWTEPMSEMPFYFPLALLGISPEALLLAQVISLSYQFVTHTELVRSLGPLEWVLNTPSHHRVHHASNLRYLDRNYSAMFIVWDRLFGTFQQEEEKVVYGLTKNIETYNPVKIAFHEWIAMGRDILQARSLRGKWMAFWGPPGWSEDGSSMTAKEAQREAGFID